jgi:hypothetical protein
MTANPRPAHYGRAGQQPQSRPDETTVRESRQAARTDVFCLIEVEYNRTSPGLPLGPPLRAATPELPTGEYLLTGMCFDPDPGGEGPAPWATLLTAWPPGLYSPPGPSQ